MCKDLSLNKIMGTFSSGCLSFKNKDTVVIAVLSLIVLLASASIFLGLSTLSNFGFNLEGSYIATSISILPDIAFIGAVSVLAIAMGSILVMVIRKQKKQIIIALLLTVSALAICSILVCVSSVNESLLVNNIVKYKLMLATTISSSLSMVISGCGLYRLIKNK